MINFSKKKKKKIVIATYTLVAGLLKEHEIDDKITLNIQKLQF